MWLFACGLCFRCEQTGSSDPAAISRAESTAPGTRSGTRRDCPSGWTIVFLVFIDRFD